MKFGGTGVDSCRNLVKVSDLVTNYKNDSGYEIVVVVSAVRGVTDSILKLTDSINRHEKVSVQDILGKLSKTHLEIIEGLHSRYRIERSSKRHNHQTPQ